jgi:hypothetical protein
LVTVSITDDDSSTPSIPANLRKTPTGIIQGGNFTVLWNASTGSPSTYRLEESIDGGVTWPVTFTINAPTLFKAFVKPNADADYLYRVKACNVSGQCSGYSSTLSVTTIAMCGSQPC